MFETLKQLSENEFCVFYKMIGLEINKERSAINDMICADTATLLDSNNNNRGYPTRSLFDELEEAIVRTELARYIDSVELRSERMLLQLLDCQKKCKEISTENTNNKLHKSEKEPEEAQLAKLFNEIENLLKKGNIRLRNEAKCKWGADGSRKTVDHLVTQSEKMLGHDYTRRHNEVIRVDTWIKTDTRYILFRLEEETITLIEKLRKCVLLANELDLIYKCSIEIITFVETWDDIKTVKIISLITEEDLRINTSSKHAIKKEDWAKQFNTKNNTLLISD
ncbi:hypothetical protein CWI38_0584p0040 [Hamiltosporidium tvaerminnensis]|uniref:Uncharacterized protein n=1 Tax=Hamiltosporidium tvaerminnensis TaxID=1176355 RepID=A0A4V2JXS8_9MICR|nr:hypothetical protein CWI38_0584p0040 [Hamiltosporidium tvaerminnensis]